MTALAGRRPSIPAVLPAEPAMSSGVVHALTAALEPVQGRGAAGDDDPGMYLPPPLLSRDDHAAASQAADQFERMLRPVTLATLGAWLGPVNLASANPLSPEAFALRATALHEMIADLPGAAFTAETRRQLPGRFFPAAAEIRATIEPVASAWRRKRDALRKLRPAVSPIAATTPDPKEREKIRNGLGELARELSARSVAEARPRPRGRPVDAETLRQLYRRAASTDGPHAASLRARLATLDP